ncbi:hypothetical protein MMIN_01250 [Mycolicibacter minnesotensis]|nr:hypothetical protein MMIN_01250 [Mycolicibacter minnesotensis]
MARWINDMIATGHSTERRTVAVLGGDVGGRNAASRAVPARCIKESAAVTSEPYPGPGLVVRIRLGQAGQ